MARTRASVDGLIRVNGADIYHEVRGAGPTVLLIHGGGADGGTWGHLPTDLSREFVVVTYDRRGLSRSPRPKDWQQTSIAEQADDAAALLRAHEVAPAAVVGASLGALVALELLLQHPDLVRRASLLDPGPLDSAIPDRRQRMVLPEPVRAAIAKGDSEAAFEALMRDLDLWDAFDPLTRQRVLGNAEVFFSYETPLLQSYEPDDARMRWRGNSALPVAPRRKSATSRRPHAPERAQLRELIHTDRPSMTTPNVKGRATGPKNHYFPGRLRSKVHLPLIGGCSSPPVATEKLGDRHGCRCGRRLRPSLAGGLLARLRPVGPGLVAPG